MISGILFQEYYLKDKQTKRNEKMRLDWSDSSVVHLIPKKTHKSDPGKVTLTIFFLDLFVLKYKHFTSYVEFICSTLNRLSPSEQSSVSRWIWHPFKMTCFNSTLWQHFMIFRALRQTNVSLLYVLYNTSPPVVSFAAVCCCCCCCHATLSPKKRVSTRCARSFQKIPISLISK